jgi:peptidoglycan/LPS O-acetylase OafA/YrhL
MRHPGETIAQYGSPMIETGPAAVGTDAPAAPTGPMTLRSLTALRPGAALLVFGFHMHVMGLFDKGSLGSVLDRVFSQGSGGFSFFFLLSGLVLVWSIRPADNAVLFWRRRIARIYPNHLATWVLALGLLIAGSAGLSLSVVLSNLFLVQAWSPDPHIYFGMNIVTWSLACEAFFYALFPLFYKGLMRIPSRALWPALGVAFAVIWTMPLIAQALPPAHRYWFIWVFPLARLPEFLTGMLLARLVREGRWPAFLRVLPMFLLVAVAYVATGWLPEVVRLVAGMAVPLALLVGAIAAVDAAGGRNPWDKKWLRRLSALSYAFYIVHSLVLRVVLKVVGTDHSAVADIGIALGALVLTLVASWLLFTFVERPGRRYLRPHEPVAGVPLPRGPRSAAATARGLQWTLPVRRVARAARVRSSRVGGTEQAAAAQETA